MKPSIRQLVLASVLAVLAFPMSIPGETHTRRLRIVADESCRVGAAMPARILALPGFSQALRRGGRVRIVAIGSSSTEGVGASSPAANYPSQLRALLETSLPRDEFDVINL